MACVPRRSDAHSSLPLRVVGADQIPFYVHLEVLKENGKVKKYKGNPIHKDGFGQKVVFI